MTRFTITVPLDALDGSLRPEHSRIAEQLIGEVTNGWTKTHGIGSWRSPEGVEYRETVAVYTIDGADALDVHVFEVAQLLATGLQQEAVYVTKQPVETFLVAPVRVAS